MGILDLFGLGGEDPASQLALRAHDDAAQNANNSSTASVLPPQVWTDPAVQPVQPAQAPVPSAPSSGGFSIGNPMQGDKLFGEDRSRDAEIDPDTGLTKGAARRVNNQAMLQSSLLMMAAGMATDEGARASIINGIPSALDTTPKLQSMAHLRLEMANARIKQAQEQQTAQQMLTQRRLLGLDGGNGVVSGVGAPVAAPTPAPVQTGPMAPVVGAPATQQAQDRVQAGTGNAADQAILRAAQSGGAPAAADPSTSPLMGAGNPTDPQTPEDRAIIAATSGAGSQPVPQAAPTVQLPPPGTTFPTSPKDTLPVPSALANGVDLRSLPLAERAAMSALPPEKFTERVNTLNDAMRKQEYPGPAYLDPTTKILMQPLYQNGNLLRSQPLGQEATNTRIFQDDQGNYRSQKVRPDNSVAEDTFVTPHSQSRTDTLSDQEFGLAKDTASNLKSRYAELQNAPQQISRAQQVIKNLDNGTVATGPTVGAGQTVGAVLANMGWASSKELEQIRNTSDAQGLTAMVSAQIAKANNPGGRITDSDQKLAEGIVGAGTAGNPGAMKDAINRYIADKQNDVALYNSDADTHLAELDRVGLGKNGYLKVRKIGGDPGNAPDLPYVNPNTAPTNSTISPGTVDTANAAPLPVTMLPGAKSASAPTASSPVPSAAASYLRANPGLKADFDRKYGAGAAASVLGK